VRQPFSGGGIGEKCSGQEARTLWWLLSMTLLFEAVVALFTKLCSRDHYISLFRVGHREHSVGLALLDGNHLARGLSRLFEDNNHVFTLREVGR
jgi:hypothetical protein